MLAEKISAGTAGGVDGVELKGILSDLTQVTHRLTRLAARATGNTESPAVWTALSVLTTHGPLRLGELAAHCRVSQPTMTKMVRNLVEAGWVERLAEREDARAWRLEITATGSGILAERRAELSAALLPLFGDLSAHDVAALRRAVQIIGSRVEYTELAVGARGAATAGSASPGPATSNLTTRNSPNTGEERA